MGWPTALLAALAATSSAPLLDEAAQAPPPQSDAEILKLDQELYSRLTVPVTIGDHGPFDFMIDTGAQATVLSLDVADRIGLGERTPASLIGMVSRMPIEVAPIDNLTLGSRMFDLKMAALIDRRNIGAADGILGLDSLQDQRVLIDFKKNTIAVADADELGGNLGYEIMVKARNKLGQLIITDARIDGIKTAVIVDTGAQGSVGNLALLERLRGRSLGTTEMTDINGMRGAGEVRLVKQLSMGKLALRSFPVVFADAPPFHALELEGEPALVLGVNELKLFRRVAIDFKSRKVLFDLPRGVTGDNPMRSAFGFF